MPSKFRRKLARFLPGRRGFFFLICLLSLISLISLIWPLPKPAFWWSILFSNPLKQTSGLTNILLLGVPGGEHEGSDLTDTMIIFSFNQKNGQTVLTSIPRDIWSPTLMAKINTAYHYGEEKKPGGGLILAKATSEEVIGLPIHYAVKIDLAGLDDIIDILGGVEVDIERAFDDYKFPIGGKENDPCDGDPEYKCRYQHIHFEAGKQILNGEKALEYVRSRNAEGEEGTDFARSKRQEKLILALKNKIFSPGFFLQPQKAAQLIKILREIVETDILQEDFAYLGKMLLKSNFGQVKTLNLEEFLVNPPVWQYGQWVLVPRTGDFTEIQQYLKEQILK